MPLESKKSLSWDESNTKPRNFKNGCLIEHSRPIKQKKPSDNLFIARLQTGLRGRLLETLMRGINRDGGSRREGGIGGGCGGGGGFPLGNLPLGVLLEEVELFGAQTPIVKVLHRTPRTLTHRAGSEEEEKGEKGGILAFPFLFLEGSRLF